jgi:hypothetical protein
MWPLSAVQFSQVTRPCYLRSCPNGPRFDQREITRMMSLLAHRVIRGAATYSVAIGCTADIDRPERWIARSRMTRNGHGVCVAAQTQHR